MPDSQPRVCGTRFEHLRENPVLFGKDGTAGLEALFVCRVSSHLSCNIGIGIGNQLDPPPPSSCACFCLRPPGPLSTATPCTWTSTPWFV